MQAYMCTRVVAAMELEAELHYGDKHVHGR